MRVQLLSQNAIAPCRQTEGAAGYDLCSAENVIVAKRSRLLVNTDIAIELPNDCCGQIVARSSLAKTYEVDVGAGLIDPDYRGPINVLLINNSDDDFIVVEGDRIAQLVLQKIETVPVIVVDKLSKTERGNGGFGSTGIN